MRKEQTYNFTRFSADVLSEAYNFFINTIKSTYNEFDENKLYIKMLLKHDDQSKWEYDDINDFFSDYRKYYKNYAKFRIDYDKKRYLRPVKSAPTSGKTGFRFIAPFSGFFVFAVRASALVH
jgi:hypothetical protein